MPDPVVSSADSELKAHVERVLSAQYELDREIGRGGMGIVYRARDRRLKRLVAVKLLPPELAFRSDIRTRFLREAETAAQLSHPNIVPIYAVDERDGLVYFVMGYVEGDNLAKRLAERGPMPVDDVRQVLREVAEALAYAHARNVVHRDIKPDNILLCEDDGRAKVTDFGIARAVSEGGGDSRLTATGMAIGTPAYMAPEQAAGDRDVDGRTDLYSLGVVGYQMLVGEPPFKAGNTPAMLVKHLSEAPVPVDQRREGVPPDLARSIMRLLEKEPANRFPTAQALVAALDGEEVPEAPEAPGSPYRAAASAGRDGTSPAAHQRVSVATRPSTGALATSGDYGDYATVATADEMARWLAPPVVGFRKKITTYLIVNVAIIFFAVFTKMNLLGISAVWGVFLAFKYAKLWSEGYDWRDVFKQPRDRLFVDVAAETIDDARSIFDRDKRAEMRERARRRRELTAGDPSAIGALPSPSPDGVPAAAARRGAVAPTSAVAEHAGRFAPAVEQAARDRAEIVRLVEAVPKREREHLNHVVPSADALFRKVEALAVSAAELERNAAPGAADVLEREITQLEAQANPLDRVASEERVRRLAYLKRQRRAAVDLVNRRDQAAAKLESCRTALQNMRYDLVRLRTGVETYDRITLVAEQAMSLARDVDQVVYAADEVARLTGNRREGGRPLAGPA
ncbi:MAG TPA: protein kinase [Gemmatimonadaceae bacterium]|nr:protein kinase [Gemmatimonadaceae bacterium]